MTRKYMLELTADELMAPKLASSIWDALGKLASQARADREAEELRLPWSYDSGDGGRLQGISFPAREIESAHAARVEHRLLGQFVSERAAKLMSAAPELLEAVQAANRHGGEWGADYWRCTVRPLIKRALDKVTTGLPEPE